MQVKFYKTKNELLKPFLEGYYFLAKNRCENIEYLTFPNNFINVSAYKNIKVTLNNGCAEISEDDSIHFNSILITNYKMPIRVNYYGKVDEISFCFNPIGINSFINNFSSYSKNQLNAFAPFDDFQNEMIIILDEIDADKRIIAIENYWLSKLNNFNNPLLANLINDVSIIENEISIGDLALKYHTSRQNINKLFNRYLGKSPNDFRKIHRFRLALRKRITLLKKNENLTSLSYESLFYDQSH
ncbi:MAG: AraC family transcriptional regulator, partial [Flavobacterium sp.]